MKSNSRNYFQFHYFKLFVIGKILCLNAIAKQIFQSALKTYRHGFHDFVHGSRSVYVNKVKDSPECVPVVDTEWGGLAGLSLFGDLFHFHVHLILDVVQLSGQDIVDGFTLLCVSSGVLLIQSVVQLHILSPVARYIFNWRYVFSSVVEVDLDLQ